ncbi:hypothetical protein G6F23_015565 [Rhizopus arrhizus]|nr:hypothetical protein G6F23_015565 [Rhizopus arrhizus]
MMERVSSGENLIGYNILGSYAETRAKSDPSLGVAYPTDYALVLSRVAFISKKAKNRNAAKLWMDYLLSQKGQEIMASNFRAVEIWSAVAIVYLILTGLMALGLHLVEKRMRIL